MIRHAPFVAVIVSLGFLVAGPAALAQESTLTRLGEVEFPVACDSSVQKDFNHAMALYHSFAWGEASRAFDDIARQDPDCGMAHWGQAMVMLSNPFAWANLPGSRLDAVADTLNKARAAGLESGREQGYVEALSAFVREHETVDHRRRLQAFDDAMARLSARYPEDIEAAICSALLSSANFDPEDKSYSNQLRAAAILEPLFEAYPNHPGIAHYLIHSYDYPPIAEKGLQAARRYAQIAPDAPHALHMPSHIFTRVGHWQDSVETNRASAAAAGTNAGAALHAHDYMLYAHLQMAQDVAAKQIMEKSLALPTVEYFGSAYVYAAMPARLALERSNWKEAARIALVPTADSYPWERYPQAEAVNAFARGVGAARSGDSEAARAEHKRLLALGDATARQNLAYWVEQVAIQAEVVRGLATLAEGKTEEALTILRAAARREDATEKHVVTPGPILPAREVLADVLLDTGRAAAALAEFEAVLNKEPNRYRAYLGAMKAAEVTGDKTKARNYATELLRLGEGADTARDELAMAKRIAAG